MGTGASSVFGALMDAYPFCKSNPSVFDLLIRVYLRDGLIDDALETFHFTGFRGFNPSVYTCNMMLGYMVKNGMIGSVWSFF
ncbi:hypothetical protein SLA2020_343870 [Shorea laevis]